jgi:hypothetical protein
MNYYFFAATDGISCSIQIPRFRNDGKYISECKLYSACVRGKEWSTSEFKCESDCDFFYVEYRSEIKDAIFFLAKPSKVNSYQKLSKHLINYDYSTDTVPAYRANLFVANKRGGHSSYQSEYPFDMVNRKGSLIASVFSLANKQAIRNVIFLRNIYIAPIKEEFRAYLVNKKLRRVLHEYKLTTNETNILELQTKFIEPENYILAEGFLGVPIYYSEGNRGEISFEHSHPPHEDISGERRNELVKKVKDELFQIIS